MRCFLIGLVGFLVTGLVALIAILSYGDYTSRASLAETFVAVRPIREKVAEALVKEPRSVARSTQAIAGVSYLKVAADGTIVFRSSKHGQVIVLEPEVRGNEVSWKCIGAPAKDVPPECR